MEINLGKLPFDIDFHPSAPLVAVALISGELHLYRYQSDLQPERLLQISAHDESCRAIRFVDSGRVVLTSSPDRSILATDVESGNAISRLEEAHENSINRLVNLTETTIASGDDEGCIKVWDTRHRSCCNSFNAHEDYISDMTFVSGTKQILATSGDGSLSVFSLRKNKVQARSEFSEDELLSVVTMKEGKKVVCGTQKGSLLLYSWGHFRVCKLEPILVIDVVLGSSFPVTTSTACFILWSDRLVGHSMSVDALLKLDEDTLISGSEDGVIRLVGILPNRIIQPLAEHSEYPIENLAFSCDRKYLGSISHDQILKLWDLEELLSGNQPEPIIQQVEADSDDSDDMDMDLISSPPVEGSSRGNVRRDRPFNSSAANFFADL